MKLSHGDIWTFLDKGYHITIPTNIGWTVSTLSPVNPMGRGLAKDAKARFRRCDVWLGNEYSLTAVAAVPMGDLAWLKLYPKAPLIFFPTKPLDVQKPWQSWTKKSDKAMIAKHLDQFPAFITANNIPKVAVPLLGAGNGGLDPLEMKTLIQEKLGDDNRFVLLTPIDL